jgi:hypothetical protein
MENQEYRINAALRRRNETSEPDNRIELCSEKYDTDEEFCLAIATELLELIKQDREFLEGRDDEPN